MKALYSNFASGVRHLYKIGVNAALPLRCRQCDARYHQRGDQVSPQSSDGDRLFGRLMADYLCPQCIAGYEPIKSPLCVRCGRPYRTKQGVDHECPDCQSRAPGFETARSAGHYDQPLKALIHDFKYQGRTELAPPLGRLLWQAYQRFYGSSYFDLIVPVPLHWYRRYRRGFNQAALMLRHWPKAARMQGVDFNPQIVSNKIIFRKRRTMAQAGLGKKQRAANLNGAFALHQSKGVKGKSILLVDDVMTTGATAAECTKVLKGAGAASVHILSLARAA